MCNGANEVDKVTGDMREKKQKREKEGMELRLVSYDELPEYMKENEFILDHYRSEWPLKYAFLSLFRWHNETLNVWTHLIGFFVFLWLTVVNLRHVPDVADLLNNFSWSISTSAMENASFNQGTFFTGGLSLAKLEKSSPDQRGEEAAAAAMATTTAETRWPFFVFMGGAMFCLLTSSLCHLLCCHTRRLNLLLARLDYVGITAMIVASFFPPIFYIFQCDPHWQLLYLAAISAMGAFTAATLFAPHLSTAPFRAFRAILFSGMALSGIVPAVHAAVVNWADPQRPVTLAWEAAMALSYIAGTLFYVGRVPERWRPGLFDLAGHSHQVFHLFVIAGALAHYHAAVIFLERRATIGCA